MVKPEQGWSKGAVSSGGGEMGRRDGEEAWGGRMGKEGRRREKEEGRGREEEGGGGGRRKGGWNVNPGGRQQAQGGAEGPRGPQRGDTKAEGWRWVTGESRLLKLESHYDRDAGRHGRAQDGPGRGTETGTSWRGGLEGMVREEVERKGPCRQDGRGRKEGVMLELSPHKYVTALTPVPVKDPYLEIRSSQPIKLR